MNKEENAESVAAPGETGGPSAAPQEPGVGEVLAQARIAKGLNVEDIARQLRFGMRQIQALEAGRFDQLPGGAFVRGIVRSYARLLNLDPAPLIVRLEGKFDAPDANRLTTLFKQPVPFSDGARRSNLVYGVVTLAVFSIAAVLAYHWYFDRESPLPTAIAPLARVLVPVVEPVPPRPVETPIAPASMATDTQAVSAPAEASLVPPSQPALPTEKSAAPPVVQAVPALGRGKRRLELYFEEESWVEVADGTGQILTSQLNLPGGRRIVDGAPPLTVVIGNAQHVRVMLSGKPIDLRPHTKVEVARLVLE